MITQTSHPARAYAVLADVGMGTLRPRQPTIPPPAARYTFRAGCHFPRRPQDLGDHRWSERQSGDFGIVLLHSPTGSSGGNIPCCYRPDRLKDHPDSHSRVPISGKPRSHAILATPKSLAHRNSRSYYRSAAHSARASSSRYYKAAYHYRCAFGSTLQISPGFCSRSSLISPIAYQRQERVAPRRRRTERAKERPRSSNCQPAARWSSHHSAGHSCRSNGDFLP